MELVPLELERVVIQMNGPQQYLYLRTEDHAHRFPIVIGDFEAFEIHRKLTGQTPPRPLTHDLVGRVLDALGAQLVKVVVSDLRDNTYYATLHLDLDGAEKEVDCRPSDAIALAVQRRAPMFVARQVLDAET